MTQHLTQQELIEHQFGLADKEKAARVVTHLDGCEQCRAALERLAKRFSALELVRDDIAVPEELLQRTLIGTKPSHIPQKSWFYKLRWVGFAAAAVVVAGAGLLIWANFADPKPQSDGFALETKRGKTTLERDDASLRWNRRPEDIPMLEKPAESTDSYASAEYDAKSLTEGDVGEEGLRKRMSGLGDEHRALGTYSYKEGAAPGGTVAEAEQPAIAGRVEVKTNDVAASRLNSRVENGAGSQSLMLASGMGKKLSEKSALIDDKPPFAPASAIELVVLPRRDDVQLTIYNSADLTLVRERRNLTLKRGWNWLQFMWADTLIDPTSLHLEPLENPGAIEVQQLVYPARLKDIARWLIRSDVEGQFPFEITYFTSGLSWRAFYMGTLNADESRMELKGYVRVANNSGEDYENAGTRLIVGEVNLQDPVAELAKRRYAYGRQAGVRGLGEFDGDGLSTGFHAQNADKWNKQFEGYLGGGGFGGYGGGGYGVARMKTVEKEGLSEYYLYTIEGTETIENTWSKRLESFSAEDVNVVSLYKYDEGRWGRQTRRFVKFTNDEDHNLGQTPIPNGNVKVFAQADEQGRLSYVGGADVKYIPVDEEAELNLGVARLVKVEPELMDFETENYRFDDKGNVNGWDEVRVWRMQVTNTRTLPVEVEITRGFGTAYWHLDLVHPASEAGDAVEYEKHDATNARFNVNVQARSKKTFGYKARTYHGIREQESTK